MFSLKKLVQRRIRKREDSMKIQSDVFEFEGYEEDVVRNRVF